MFTIIIPANNEERYLGRCLDGLVAQTLGPEQAGGVEVIVAANACTDRTVAIAGSYRERFAAKGWDLKVLDIPEGGKVNALNRADAAAPGGIRAYLDADVVCAPTLMEKLHAALGEGGALYASGHLEIAPAESWVSRRFARLFAQVPYMQVGVPGAGLFAVSPEGRARWDSFPQLIADDGYVRLLFTHDERVKVDASYTWPVAEGFAALVKVRRRQDRGTAEIAEKFPDLVQNESKAPRMTAGDYLGLFTGQPLSFLVYVSVLLTVRFGPRREGAGWTRGR